MTHLRKRVLEEIERRNYTQATAHAYVSAIRRFAEHFHRSPEKLSLAHVRAYQLYRIERKIIGDPLKDMPALDPNPPPFEPTGRYTAERKKKMDELHPEGFLWPAE